MREERGQALVAVILVFTIIVALGTALLGLASMEKRMAVTQSRGTQALFLADGGVQYALARLRSDRDWRSSSGVTIPLGPGSFTVTVLDGSEPEKVEITVNATAGPVTRTIRATATVRAGAFSYALLAFGDGSRIVNAIASNIVVQGDGLFNRELAVGANPQVDGRFYVNGILSGAGAETLRSEEKVVENAGISLPELPIPTYPSHPFPSWPANWYLDGGLGTPVTYNRDVTRTRDLQVPGANYYIVQGDVELGSTRVNLNGITVVASGRIRLGSRSSFQNVTLKAGEYVQVRDDANVLNSRLVADGDVQVGEQATFSGTVYGGDDVSLDDGLSVTTPSTVFAAGNLDIGRNAELQGEFYSQAMGFFAGLEVQQGMQAVGPLLLQAAGNLQLGPQAAAQGAQLYSGGTILLGDGLEGAGMLASAGWLLTIGGGTTAGGLLYSKGMLVAGDSLTSDGALGLVAAGDIILGRNADIRGVAYSAGGTAYADSGLSLAGSLVAEEINLGQDAAIIYDAQYVAAAGMEGSGGVSLNSWDEQ